jgi:hypothetical protein
MYEVSKSFGEPSKHTNAPLVCCGVPAHTVQSAVWCGVEAVSGNKISGGKPKGGAPANLNLGTNIVCDSSGCNDSTTATL